MGAASRLLTRSACFGGVIVLMMHSPAVAEKEIVLSVPGIPGPYCAYGVEKRLFELDGVQRVDLLWNEEKIRIGIADGKLVTREQILEAVERADYPYEYTIEAP